MTTRSLQALGTWRVPALAAFFLSGAAGLIAQVCWIRRAGLAFGSTVEALGAVLAVFFGGLALGAYIFGERSRHIERPLRAYALLEVALALAVVATPYGFDAAESVYGVVYRSAAAPTAAVQAARVALVALVLLLPTLLMGGTLPLLCRQLVGDRAHVGRTVGFLYGINTLGAALGAAVCGFVLLPELGMRRTLLLAAALELGAATLAALAGWQRRAPEPTPASGPRAAPRVRGGAAARAAAPIVAAVFFCTGFAALGNEVVWTRFLALLVRTTVLTYTVCLTVVLIGIVLGACVSALVVDRRLPRARLLGALQVASGLGVLALMLLPAGAWRSASGEWAYGLLLLPPAVLSGAIFPLVVRMVVDDPAPAAASVGRLTAVNTVGGIVGSLLIGLLVLPRFGLLSSVYLTTGVALASGCAAWWFLDRQVGRAARLALIAVCVLAWAALPRLVGTRLPQDFLADASELVDFREGRESNLAVVRRNGRLVLEADRWWQGQDRKTHQILAAHLPLLLHPAPGRVLVVGVGAGRTPASVLLHDIQQLDCVDIEPAVFDLVRAHFDSAWTRDRRVRLIREDGRSYVMHSAAMYDVIALEVGQVFRPGVANFYTVDFYRRVAARLAPGGIVSQFVPLTFLSVESFRSVVATFLEVFPHSVLWYNTAEVLLIGTNGARVELLPERLDLLTSNGGIHADLQFGHWGGPAYWLNQPQVLLGGFLMGPRGLRTLAAGAPIERDDRQVLGYATRDANELQSNEASILDLMRPLLAPVGDVVGGAWPDPTLVQAAEVRARNLDDVLAAALLRRVDALVAAGQFAELGTLLMDAQRINPQNVQAHRLEGDLALYRGDAAHAQRAYAATLQLDPSDTAAHLGLARSLHLQHQASAAVEHYRVWLAEHPDDADVHAGLAAALAEQGDLAGAEQHLEAAVQLRPGWADASTRLARVRAARQAPH